MEILFRCVLKNFLALCLTFFVAFSLNNTPLLTFSEEPESSITTAEVVPENLTKPDETLAEKTDTDEIVKKEIENDVLATEEIIAEQKASDNSAASPTPPAQPTPPPMPTPAPDPSIPFCKRGIDVSHHNGDINWQAVKDSGIEFAIIRTGYGWMDWEKQTDRQLRNNIAGAKAVGMPIGAYHYSYATNPHEANLEADFFIDRLRWTQWEYPVYIDLEDNCQKRLTNTQRTDIILTFLQRLQAAGYYTGFYTCLYWQRHMLEIERLSGHQLWIAQWNTHCNCTVPYGIWQRTSHGSVPGINGRVDLDLCYVDFPSIIKNAHLNGF